MESKIIKSNDSENQNSQKIENQIDMEVEYSENKMETCPKEINCIRDSLRNLKINPEIESIPSSSKDSLTIINSTDEENTDNSSQEKQLDFEIDTQDNPNFDTLNLEKVCIDVCTNMIRSRNGNTSFFVMVDLLTRYPIVYPSKKADANTMVEFLERSFLMFGVPKIIISDNGKQFVSKAFKELCEKWKIKSETTPYYHPQSNPAERVIQVIKNSIKSFSSKSHHEWDEHIHEYVAGIRSSIHESTKMTPYFMLFSQDMYLQGNYGPLDFDKTPENSEKHSKPNETDNRIIQVAKENIIKAQKHYSEVYNRDTKMIKYSVGDHVYRRNFKLSNALDKYSSKLADQFINATVIKDLGSGTYILKDFDGKEGKYHANHMKPGLKIISHKPDKNQSD